MRPRVFHRSDVKYLATLAAVANVLLLAAILTLMGAFMTKHRLTVGAAIAAAAFALSACSTLGTGDSQASVQLLQNLRHCDRTYIAGAGGMAPPNASVSITCKAEPYAPPATTAAAAAPAEAPPQ